MKNIGKIAAIVLLGMVGCTSPVEESTTVETTNSLLVNIDKSALSQGDNLGEVTIGAYGAGGELLEVVEGAILNSDGLYVVDVDPAEIDRVVILAGDEPKLSGAIQPTLSALNSYVIESSADALKPFYQMSKAKSEIKGGYLSANLERGVASIDIRVQSTQEVEVSSLKVSGLAQSTNLMAGYSKSVGTQAAEVELTTFSTPEDGYYRDVLLMYEQVEADIYAVIEAKFSGYSYRLEVALPETINRNERYVININSEGAKLTSELKVEDWGVKTDIDAEPSEVLAKVDSQNSLFPEGATLSASLDTIFVNPDFAGSVTLALDVNGDVQLSDPLGEFELTSAPSASPQGYENTFTLKFEAVNILKQLTYTKLFVKAAGEELYSDQYITVVRVPYRTRFAEFEGNSVGTSINYGDYRDGRLATISSLYEIESIVTESMDAQFDWLRVDPVEGTEGQYNLEGGFKPNDAEATGQLQGSSLVVTYSDGYVETFTFQRYRKSLPTVLINGQYWMKYNLRGRSNMYEDQISFDQDQADLWNYLKSATAEEFELYAGGHYKGVETTSLTLVNQTDSTLILQGYDDIPAANTNAAAADYMTPAGFILPSTDDIGNILTNNGTLTLHSTFDHIDRYNTNSGKRMQLVRTTRNIEMHGVVDYPIYSVLVASNDDPTIQLVFLSLGSQNYEGIFNPEFFGIAIDSPSNNNHYSINHTNRQMRIMSYLSSTTRSLRAVKTPVTYIVEE